MRSTNRAALTALMLGMTLVAGCNNAPYHSTSYPLVSQPLTQPVVRDLKSIVYTASDAMIYNLGDKVPRTIPILPATFVNQDNLDQSSPLGRRLALMMSDRFTQRGYSLLELKVRNQVKMEKGSGEFMLSRDLADVRSDHKVRAVLVGSYMVTRSTIEVSSRLVRLKDRMVLSAQDYTLPLAPNRELL